MGAIYCIWATLAILFAVLVAGPTPESATRVLVIVFLLGQVVCRERLARSLPWLPPRARFIALGTLLAAVVEGFHMISMPVFPSLRIGWDTSFSQGLVNYALDLLYTVPAYLVIFLVLWRFLARYQYEPWTYVVVFGAAQALGDGGLIYFAGAPAMIFFLPYPMTNYHAVNVIPFLAVRGELPGLREESPRKFLALPAIIATYFVCGAIIRVVGRRFGLE